jgi:hypothetical protein
MRFKKILHFANVYESQLERTNLLLETTSAVLPQAPHDNCRKRIIKGRPCWSRL